MFDFILLDIVVVNVRRARPQIGCSTEAAPVRFDATELSLIPANNRGRSRSMTSHIRRRSAMRSWAGSRDVSDPPGRARDQRPGQGGGSLTSRMLCCTRNPARQTTPRDHPETVGSPDLKDQPRQRIARRWSIALDVDSKRVLVLARAGVRGRMRTGSSSCVSSTTARVCSTANHRRCRSSGRTRPGCSSRASSTTALPYRCVTKVEREP